MLYHYGMPTENEYPLQDLADLAGITPRTIRYYVAQGLLASPGRVGPGAKYGEGHLARLRLIRQLQREHLPLAEIRVRLASLDDATVADLVGARPEEPGPGSAVDYIRRILAGQAADSPFASGQPGLPSLRSPAVPHLSMRIESEPSTLATPVKPGPEPSIADRSQWDRVLLAPDVELHVRRPLGRRQNKQVERLIAIAREILQEDKP